jgi:hypothetical protein
LSSNSRKLSEQESRLLQFSWPQTL